MTEPPVHKPLVVNVVFVGQFELEEEEEGNSLASDVVKVEGEDQDTPGYLRGDRVRRDVSDLGSWVRLPWLAHDETPGPYITIPQYRVNKTKQHTQQKCESLACDLRASRCYLTGSQPQGHSIY